MRLTFLFVLYLMLSYSISLAVGVAEASHSLEPIVDSEPPDAPRSIFQAVKGFQDLAF